MNKCAFLVSAAVLGGFPPPAAAQAVYKCTDAKGQPVFQQHPCDPGTGGRIAVRPMNTVEGDPDGDRQSRARANRGALVDRAVARGLVVAGMSEAEMSQVMGRPSSVNTSVVNGVVHKQFVYLGADGSTRYVYTRDGEVWARQHQEPVAPRPTEPCHSRLAIANARTSAGSLLLSPAERQQALDRVREMEECRR